MTRLKITIKIFMLFIIVFLTSCRQNNKLSDHYKNGLLSFSVNESNVTRQLEDTVNGKAMDFGSLWIDFNKINVRKSQDTLIVDVNFELSKTLNYDGGFEFTRDTLFLYAKNLDKDRTKEKIQSTLTYKILTTEQAYNEIEFREIK